MSSAQITILAALCLVCGAVLLVLTDDDTMPVMLLMAGAGVLTQGLRQANQKNNELKVEATQARAKAERAMEETATLRRDLIEKDKPK